MTDFVLLHGTTQSPAGWDRLVGALNRRGHDCWVVDLAGSPERTAEEYAGEVRAQVPADVGAPVVVAHSGAGLVLPGAARALRASQQVWLAAIVPDGRRPLIEEMAVAATAIFNDEWLGKDPTRDSVLAAYFLFHDCNLATLQWALTTLRLFTPARLYRTAVPLAGETPSTYIVCSRDRTLRPDWCREQAGSRLDARVLEIDAGHCPHVSRPEELADLLAT